MAIKLNEWKGSVDFNKDSPSKIKSTLDSLYQYLVQYNEVDASTLVQDIINQKSGSSNKAQAAKDEIQQEKVIKLLETRNQLLDKIHDVFVNISKNANNPQERAKVGKAASRLGVVKDKVKGAMGKFGEAVSKTKGFLDKLLDFFKNPLAALAGLLPGVLSKLGAGMLFKLLGKMIGGPLGLIGKIAKFIGTNASRLVGALGSLLWNKILKPIWNTFGKPLWDKFKSGVSKTWDKFKNKISGKWDRFKGSMSKKWGNFKKGVGQKLADVGKWMKDSVGKIWEKSKSLWKSSTKAAGKAWQKGADLTKKGLGFLKEKAGGVWNKISGAFGKIGSWFSKGGSKALKIASFIPKIGAGIISKMIPGAGLAAIGLGIASAATKDNGKSFLYNLADEMTFGAVSGIADAFNDDEKTDADVSKEEVKEELKEEIKEEVKEEVDEEAEDEKDVELDDFDPELKETNFTSEELQILQKIKEYDPEFEEEGVTITKEKVGDNILYDVKTEEASYLYDNGKIIKSVVDVGEIDDTGSTGTTIEKSAASTASVKEAQQKQKTAEYTALLNAAIGSSVQASQQMLQQAMPQMASYANINQKSAADRTTIVQG